MLAVSGQLMNRDVPIATIENGKLIWTEDSLLPLYLKRTGNLEQSPAVASMLYRMELPKATPEIIQDCLRAVPIQADETYFQQFLLNGQQRMEEILEAQFQVQDELPEDMELD